MSQNIVVKIGTQPLLNELGLLNTSMINNIANQIVMLKKKGVGVILVSSGAVGAGRSVWNSDDSNINIVGKQILASIGQPLLMNSYIEGFKEYGLICSQLLLSKQDFDNREHYLNIAGLLNELLKRKDMIPIINENDSVALKELLFTDNDELAGLVATQINADKLIILTSVEGVYDGNPDDTNSKLIKEIDFAQQIDISVGSKSSVGRGGMSSKLETARKMAELGIETYISSCYEKDILLNIIFSADKSYTGTHIKPLSNVRGKKRWLATETSRTRGCIRVNKRLAELLFTDNKALSILPVGIISIDTEFAKDDVIEVCGESGELLGFGLAKYASELLHTYLGKRHTPLLIHYDSLFIKNRKINN